MLASQNFGDNKPSPASLKTYISSLKRKERALLANANGKTANGSSTPRSSSSKSRSGTNVPNSNSSGGKTNSNSKSAGGSKGGSSSMGLNNTNETSVVPARGKDSSNINHLKRKMVDTSPQTEGLSTPALKRAAV